MSALHIACVKGHTECLERMIEPQPGAAHKINLDVKNKVTVFCKIGCPRICCSFVETH